MQYQLSVDSVGMVEILPPWSNVVNEIVDLMIRVGITVGSNSCTYDSVCSVNKH